MGSQICQVAVAWQLYLLTHSALSLGLLGLVRFIPIAAMALVGGVIADAVDRRRLLIAAQGIAVAQQGMPNTQEMVDALPKDPRVPEDSIAETELVRRAAMGTVPCRIATEAYSILNTAVLWWYRSAILVLLVSTLPWLRHFVRRPRPG